MNVYLQPLLQTAGKMIPGKNSNLLIPGAYSSVGLERLVYTQKVGGSTPSTPTKHP